MKEEIFDVVDEHDVVIDNIENFVAGRPTNVVDEA